jgi:glycosyltransferase involved in cell wall biosynthesis
MTEKNLRVAFFPDSYLEINGAAMTSQKLTGFARKRGYPFLCIHAGKKTEVTTDGNYVDLSLKRSPLSFTLDEDLKYDPFFNRHLKKVRSELKKFRPDVIHITGLNDVSIIGVWLAHKFKIPLVGSWHTNVHEFAATRLDKMFSFLPDSFRHLLTGFAERKILDGTILYYKIPKVILAPNDELIKLLAEGTNRQVRLMTRGVDTETYSPAKRTARDGVFRFGFVGRLRAEKNVRMLASLEKKLFEAGKTNFKFSIIGEGNEREWLTKNMTTAELPGFLEGDKLSEAYANIDVFVFPSETDAFGNVIQEANASGVPALVTALGGPKFIVRHGENGFIAESLEDFVKFSLELMNNPEKLAIMKRASREFALSRSWDSVFEKVYDSYEEAYTRRSSQIKTDFSGNRN